MLKWIISYHCGESRSSNMEKSQYSETRFKNEESYFQKVGLEQGKLIEPIFLQDP